MKSGQLVKLITIVCWLASPSVTVHAAVYYVDAVAADGDGSKGAPFNSIQDGLNAAEAGDIVRVLPGEYVVTDYQPTYRKEAVCAFRSVRGGAAGWPITITANDPNNRPVIKMGVTDVTQLGRPYHVNDKSFMAYINHKHITRRYATA